MGETPERRKVGVRLPACDTTAPLSTFWPTSLREPMKRLRRELVAAGARTGWIDRTEQLVLADNARALYRLG